MEPRRASALAISWPVLCMGLLALSAVGIACSLALLGRVGVELSFVLSGLSLLALLVGIAGLQWWAMLDVLRSSEPPEARLLHGALILLLVPVGAILYYWQRGRSSPSPPSSPRD